MEDFPNASTYCQWLKILSDQRKNVGAPISNNRLVLQLVASLAEAYKGVCTIIHQSDPLPLFYLVHSMLILKETDSAKQHAIGSNIAMLAQEYDDNSSYGHNHRNHHHIGG